MSETSNVSIFLRAALALEQACSMSRLDAAAERRDHAHSGDDDTSHRPASKRIAARQCERGNALRTARRARSSSNDKCESNERVARVLSSSRSFRET